VEFVVDSAALGQILSEYFCFPCVSHSTDCSTVIIIHHHSVLVK
jgi:hypothetical protein